MENNKVQRSATFWDHLALILKWRKLVIIFMAIMAVSAITYALIAKKWYYSDARVLPPPSQTMGFGGLIPDLGMGLLGNTIGLSSDVKLLVTVLNSRKLKDRVIDRFNWQELFKLKFRLDAYERYFKEVSWEISEEGAIYLRVNDTDPNRAAETVNFIVDELAYEYNAITVAQARNQREFIEKRMNKLMDDLEKAEEEYRDFQSRTGAIAIEDQLRSTVSAIAQIKTEQILAEVQADVLEKTLPRSSSMVLQARQRAKALARQVDDMMMKADEKEPSVLIDIKKAPDIGIDYLRLYREIELQSKVLEFLLPQYEQAKIAESRDKGELYILDEGKVAEKRFKPKRSFVILAWMFISFLIIYMYIAFFEWLHRLRDVAPSRYETVSGVLNGLKPRNLFDWKEKRKPGDSRE